MSRLPTEWYGARSGVPFLFRLSMSCALLSWVILSLLLASATADGVDENLIDFESVEITGRWIETWEEKGVVFSPAHVPKRSQAKARLMFFPHISSGRKGILSAMANDPIPVRIQFPSGVASATLVLWGSTGCRAQVVAFDSNGGAIDKTSVEAVPRRQRPGDPIPTIELKVHGTQIAYIEFSGPREGEYLALDAIRFVPLSGVSK